MAIKEGVALRTGQDAPRRLLVQEPGEYLKEAGISKPRQHLCYVYASLSRLDFQGFFENAILVFLGITDFSPSKKPTSLMMHW